MLKSRLASGLQVDKVVKDSLVAPRRRGQSGNQTTGAGEATRPSYIPKRKRNFSGGREREPYKRRKFARDDDDETEEKEEKRETKKPPKTDRADGKSGGPGRARRERKDRSEYK